MLNKYSIQELKNLGVTVYGNNIQISKFVNIYNPKNLILYDNIRIDDFTVISCKGIIEIHNYVHIGAQCFISSSTKIIFEDYTGISPGVKVFGASDDFSGNFLTNPTIPKKYLNVKEGDIIFKKHSLVGSNSVILPNITLGEGSCVGAMSLINKNTEDWSMYVGSPIKFLKKRNINCVKLQNDLETEICLYSEFEKEKNLNSIPISNDIICLNKKNILITGGSRGIGREIAINFLKLGYNVIITYNNSEEKALELQKQGIFIYKLNILNYNDCLIIINNIIQKFNKIDILVNNAGILENSLFHKMSYDTWNNVINTNLNSIYNITHPIINNMIQNNNGRIINISSISGLKGIKGQTNYCASKFGIIGFTKSLALEYSKYNIYINAICPGLVDTDMCRNIDSTKVNITIQNNPIKKLIEPYEIFKICELLSNSEYYAGSVFNIDCGMNI